MHLRWRKDVKAYQWLQQIIAMRGKVQKKKVLSRFPMHIKDILAKIIHQDSNHIILITFPPSWIEWQVLQQKLEDFSHQMVDHKLLNFAKLFLIDQS